ncbi:cellulase [Terrimicrobium sacchariphilum]|uniref:Cellulase n=1 Tax=Terrimicrobium sacchariphilum TaxID=690879 RepID=A0A146G454_TERSA|nr:cellulase family glycosylhydrolase [Terrimicrobium sacchariphilum]GAT32222.1 cellulase [Terrimicrobium sacchariphilum]
MSSLIDPSQLDKDAALSTAEFLGSGILTTGANYWASHAGIFMWQDWRPDIVREDMRLLSGAGLQILRVFPLWSDFQPIHSQRGYHGNHIEFRLGEDPLPDNVAVASGVSEEMLDRFGVLADLAEEFGLQLIVGLITGWMSGRFFAPPALESRNAITDPLSIRWQVRFVSALIRRFETHPAIRAWDLGNECNCMGPAARDQAWLWTATLANAIRVADPTRPIISGMHSLDADPTKTWTIRDQAEHTDILTTHPYPLFTPHCHREPLDTMRPLLHASAETCLYADLSGKPTFVEEFGTLSPMGFGEEASAAMVKVRMFDLWAHDCRAALWWCAHDQRHLTQAPYDWLAVERELGLFRDDGSPKPVLDALSEAHTSINSLPIDRLPRRRTEAVCLLTPGQDNWGVAYSTFVLAKQAGFDLTFHYVDRALPDAGLYLLPSMKSYSALSRGRERELWEKVAAGATLYVSFDAAGFLSDWVGNSGIEVLNSSERAGESRFHRAKDDVPFSLAAAWRIRVRTSRAQVLASESDGNPVFLVSEYGKGRVYSLMLPLEASVAVAPEAFLPETLQPFWELYRDFADHALASRVIRKNSPWLGVTEHPDDDDGVIVVFINYSPLPMEDEVSVAPAYRWAETWLGSEPVSCGKNRLRLQIPPHSTVVARVSLR